MNGSTCRTIAVHQSIGIRTPLFLQAPVQGISDVGVFFNTEFGFTLSEPSASRASIGQWRMSRGQQRPSCVSIGWARDIVVRGARAAAGSSSLAQMDFEMVA